MFGAFLDGAMNIPKIMHAEEMQQDAQEHGFASQLQAQEFSSAQAATQHQRAVVDLRAAGLNPILSARLGGNAAMGGTPVGAGGGAAQLSSQFTQGQLSSAQVANIEMDTRKKDAERSLASQHYNESQARTDHVNEQYRTQRELTQRAHHEAGIASNSAKGAELEGDIDETKYGALMRYINRAIRAITGGSSAYRNLQQ